MIQKTILVKAAAAAVGVMAAAGAVMAVNRMSAAKDSYRSIQIYEMRGTAEIEREGTGKISGAENLYLESGDLLTVEEDSFTRLRLDEDKYILVEENSALSIEAAGSKENSRTKINLSRGAIINEIENPLNSGSSYEIATPNSIMAVRGTIFRVEVYYDENGEVFTKVSVFEGQVSSRLIYPDGTMAEEVVTGGGREVIIHSNEELTEYLGEARDITYEELPIESLRIIRNMIDNGSVIQGITKNELEELLRRPEENLQIRTEAKESEGTENKAEVKETEEITGEQENTKGTGIAEESENTEEKTENESQRKLYPQQMTESIGMPGIMPAPESPSESMTVSIEEETTVSPTEQQIPVTGGEKEETSQYDSSNGSDNSGSSSGGSSGGSRPWERPTEVPTEEPTEESTEEPTEAPTEESTEVPTEPSAELAEYTVTFMYNGTVFGSQQVKDGECAVEPWLKPETFGRWDHDFSAKITENTTIEWR